MLAIAAKLGCQSTWANGGTLSRNFPDWNYVDAGFVQYSCGSHRKLCNPEQALNRGVPALFLRILRGCDSM